MLAPFQHTLNILRHNLPDTLNLALRRPQRILLTGLRAALLQHQPLQRAIEARTAIRRQIVEVCACGLELGEELLLEVGQEAKGNALAEIALCDDEEGEAAGCGLVTGEVRGRFDKAVDEEFGLVDCLVGRSVVRNAREDEGDERRGVGRGRRCVFGEDGGVVGYACAGGFVSTFCFRILLE